MNPDKNSGASCEVASVLMVAPPADAVGGIATVARQMADLHCHGRYRIVPFHGTCSPGSAEPLHRRVLRHIRQPAAIRAAVRRERCRIVHLHTCSGFSFFRAAFDMLAAKQLGCRAVLHVHGAAFDQFHDRSTRPVQRLIRWTLTSADAVLALSERWRATLKRIAPRANVRAVENAVEAPPAIPRRERRKSCRFLLLARMDEWKGVDDLLAAARICRDRGSPVDVVLAGPAGSAGDAPTLSSKIRRLGLESSVQYVGTVLGPEKADLLNAADCLVQPSHCEGMPISMLEALAHGLPVVATAVGSVPEVITDGREGLLVPARSPELLADALIRMSTDFDRRQVMGEHARRLADTRFGLHRFERDLTELYDGLMKTSSRAESLRGRPLAV